MSAYSTYSLGIIITSVALLLLALVMHISMRKRDKTPKSTALLNENGEPLTADEAVPTQTGRYRVMEMLKRTTKQNEEQPKCASCQCNKDNDDKDSDIPLPDPF